MTLGRAAAAIGVVVVTTVWAEGTSLVTAPLGASLVSLRHSPAGSGNPVGQASLTAPASALPLSQTRQKTHRATETVSCREAVIR